MIKISVRGLAKFMTSGAVAQRKVLRDFKYQDEDEPTAMRLYYKDATDRIQAFHRSGHPSTWLEQKAADLSQLARLTPGRAGTRLRHNARALLSYEAHFADRQFSPQSQLRLRLGIGDVTITVSPEIYALERGATRVVKLDFSKDAPSTETVKIVSQVMFEAAKTRLGGIRSTEVMYFDVARGAEHKAARAGARTLREIEAACANIEALWPGI
jgi:hypothetical protein